MQTEDHEALPHPEPGPGEATQSHAGTPLPVPDPRGYDSTSFHRDFGKYPASMREKIQGLFGAVGELYGGSRR